MMTITKKLQYIIAAILISATAVHAHTVNYTDSYKQWINDHVVDGDDLTTDDADSDGMNNLLEYALGGDPTKNDAATIRPIFTWDEEAKEFNFAYTRRSYANSLQVGLSYTVKHTSDLALNVWNDIDTEDEVVNSRSGFEDVIKRIPLDVDDVDAKFLKLEVGYNGDLESDIPGAKDYHFTFEDILEKKIGVEGAVKISKNDGNWVIGVGDNAVILNKLETVNATEAHLHGLLTSEEQIKSIEKGGGEQGDNINTLIDKVSQSTTYNTIYFPEGTYLCERKVPDSATEETLPPMKLKSGVNIIGDGQGKTILERDDGTEYMFKSRDIIENIVIANLTLRTSTHRGIEVHNATNIKFFHVEFDGAQVTFRASKDLHFEGNHFKNSLGKAGYASGAVDRDLRREGGCQFVTIKHNDITNSTQGGLNLSVHYNSHVAYNKITSENVINSGYAGIRLPNNSEYNIVEYNYIKNYGRGLFVLSKSKYNTLRYNLIDTTNSQGILIQSSDNVIEGNVIKDAGEEAIRLYYSDIDKSYPKNNHVAHNIVYDETSNSSYKGLQVSGEGASDNEIVKNIVSKKINDTRTISIVAGNDSIDNIVIE